MPPGFPRWFPRTPAGRRRVRRGLRAVLSWALLRRSLPYPLENDAALWIVAPHQDDCALGCGGLIALKRLEGAAVRIVYLTDGAASHPGHPTLAPAALAERRSAEARAAAAILGVDLEKLTFLGAADGTLDRLAGGPRAAAVQTLAAALRQDLPAEIFLPYRRDGSSEHEAGFALVREALAAAGLRPRIFEYPIWAWWNPLRLARPLFSARRVWRVDHSGYQTVKRAALAAFATQMQPTAPWAEAVLSPEFVAAFGPPLEYFFELPPP